MVKLRTRVALVEDDVSVRRAIARLLRTMGYEVEVFGSDTEFLEPLRSFNPNCIILDLQLKNMKGFDVQRRLARMGSPAPVIVITGRDSAKERSEAFALGAAACLAKPIHDTLLLTNIERVTNVPG